MKIKYVEKRQRAAGRVVWVVNPPTHLRDSIQAEYKQFDILTDANEYAQELMDLYSDYKRGIHREIRAAEGTVNGLISYYRSTNDYQKLSDNSKRFYVTMIKEAARVSFANGAVFGEMKSSNVTPEHADKLYLKLQELKSQHRATHVCKVLRKIWFMGMRAGRVKNNPFQRMNLKGLEDRKVLWEPEQVEKFIQTADEMNMRSIGTMALLCYDLCQRPGDMRQLTWGNLKGECITFTQEKTGTEVTIPCSPRLMSRLIDVMPPNASNTSHIVLCEATGKPFDRRLYSKWAARVRNQSKLPPELQIRDLRRTGATEMAEAGCTEDELRSVTGHQSRDVLSIYVRPTIKLAAAGVNKRFQQC
jgi:integrase